MLPNFKLRFHVDKAKLRIKDIWSPAKAGAKLPHWRAAACFWGAYSGNPNPLRGFWAFSCPLGERAPQRA